MKAKGSQEAAVESGKSRETQKKSQKVLQVRNRSSAAISRCEQRREPENAEANVRSELTIAEEKLATIVGQINMDPSGGNLQEER